MPRAVFLLLLPLLAGCAAGATSGGPVRLGQTAQVGGARVRVDRVVEDSRCPVDTQCVWAGRLIVRATVLGRTRSEQRDLTLGRPVAVADGTLTLVAAGPARRAADAPRRYRFTFALDGKP